MAYVPQIGHHVKVADKSNFYNGREAVIIRGPIRLSGKTDYWIVKFTGTNVEFALSRAKMSELKYTD